MDDEALLAAAAVMHPTAGYLFAEELEIHFMVLDDDVRSMLLDGDNAFSFVGSSACTSPSSPSSVVYLPSYNPPSPLKMDDFMPEILRSGDDDDVFIKAEPLHDLDFVSPCTSTTTTDSFLKPGPVRASRSDDSLSESERERLRCRQRGYEKRYRGRKRQDLKAQRDTWLALEMKLEAARKKHCRPYVRVKKPRSQSSLQSKMLQLLQEERALLEDRVALDSLRAWEKVSRIREYSDKAELRTASEWRHSAEKVIGRCGMLEPRRFHPYAPLEQRHFTW